MKNRYGGPLRRMVAERFHLKYYIDMVDTPPFIEMSWHTRHYGDNP